MVLKVCNLEDGDARAAYKTADFDFRQYKKLKMYIHAEKSVGNLIDDNATRYADGALSVFIRIGADFDQNYYEYEIPLVFTDWFEKTRTPSGPDATTWTWSWPSSSMPSSPETRPCASRIPR
jgi:cell surface protein SprA